jgi:hypothetical protein
MLTEFRNLNRCRDSCQAEPSSNTNHAHFDAEAATPSVCPFSTERVRSWQEQGTPAPLCLQEARLQLCRKHRCDLLSLDNTMSQRVFPQDLPFLPTSTIWRNHQCKWTCACKCCYSWPLLAPTGCGVTLHCCNTDFTYKTLSLLGASAWQLRNPLLGASTWQARPRGDPAADAFCATKLPRSMMQDALVGGHVYLAMQHLFQ